jgi:hypothetical protein
MEQVVVPRTDEDEVVEAGGAAVGDPADVVSFCPVGGPITAGEPAVPVADDEAVVEVGGDRSGGGAVVQDAGPAVGDHPVDAGVATQALHGPAVEDRPVEESAVAAVFEVGEGGDDVEVRAVAAPAAVALVVEKPTAHVDKGVGAALRRAAGGFAVDVGGGGEAQGGGDDGTALGIEAAG